MFAGVGYRSADARSNRRRSRACDQHCQIRAGQLILTPRTQCRRRFLVLDGVFSDEHANYGVGLLRSQSARFRALAHSKDGCRILVKLRQFDPQDLSHVVVDTADNVVWPNEADSKVLELHTFGDECVRMLRLDKGQPFPRQCRSRRTGGIRDQGHDR